MNRPTPRVLCLTMNPAVDLATETERVVPTRLGSQCASRCPTGGPSGQWLERPMRDDGLTRFCLQTQNKARSRRRCYSKA